MTQPDQAGHPSNPATTRRNRLANETSPYLLQHQANPVDWYPWGQEALSRARAEDKPIFLSIGYSSCHWCHVMERESFENEAIAQLLNEHFVAVKVDREERPDLDDTYMRAVQLMTGSGGWPMSVWLTPDLEPFYGGTYFPPTDRYGRPGFASVLRYLAELWVKHRDKAIDSGKQMAKHLASMLDAGRTGAERPDLDVAALLTQTVDSLFGYFDPREGGFGGAPKFPHPMDLAFLLRRQVRGRADVKGAIELSLSKMARGGIYDQVGGGFHRYAVDEHWLVPHFEKMLYDNALLLPVYAEAARAYSVPLYERVARETADYVLREMTDQEGAFFCATDADSEGEEGLYFTWTMLDLERVLGSDRGRAFGKAFGATDSGNFERGRNVLEQLCDEATRASFAAERAKLYAERDTRIKPLLDDKILVEWNGLMIAGLARAGALLGEPRYVAAAQRAATFLLDQMWDGKRLLRTHRGGISKIDAFLSDYANLAHGLLELSGVATDPRFLRAAIEVVDVARMRFGAPDGGYFSTSLEHEALLGRSRDPYDNATPSGNSVMATNLLRLAEITGEAAYEDEARRAVAIFASNISDSPAGFGWLVQAADLLEKPPTLVVIVGDPNGDARALHAAAHASFRPGAFVLATDGKSAADPSAPGALAGKSRVAGQPAAYVCTHGRCLAPTTSPQQLGIQLDAR